MSGFVVMVSCLTELLTGSKKNRFFLTYKSIYSLD